jgi:hypothetical protein
MCIEWLGNRGKSRRWRHGVQWSRSRLPARQHVAIEKQQRRLRLILRRRRHHLARHRQMRQKSLQIARTQIFRVLFAMKKKLSFNPINIRLPGADAVMFHPQLVTHLVE